ncbi:MAG: efflux RND transporter periplasmic adaptor subunit [Bradyrhizobium sp.]
MSERSIPDPSQPGAPSKLVPFPVTPPVITPTTKPASRFRKYWLIVGLPSLLVVAIAAVMWWTLDERSTVHYVTAPVAKGPVIRTVTATGTVNPELTIIVGAAVSGFIQQLYCDYNTRVKKGQVCARIDPRPYQSVVDQNKANLAVAKAQLEKDEANLNYARLALGRAATLLPTHAVSQDAYDSAKNTYDQAVAQITFDEATVQQRQASLDAAQVNLDYTDIVSPVDGTVVSRNVTMGQTVAASFQTPTLFLIATDLARMQVDANVSESDIGGIKLGNKATFTVDAYAKRTFEGTVSQVRQSPQTVQNVVTYDIVISVDNTDLTLMPGMTAASRIVIDQRNDVIRVPNQALRYVPKGLASAVKSDQAKIWALRDGEPTSVAVVPGLDDDNFTEIISGDVKPGDLVITAEKLTTASKTVTPRLGL